LVVQHVAPIGCPQLLLFAASYFVVLVWFREVLDPRSVRLIHHSNFCIWRIIYDLQAPQWMNPCALAVSGSLNTTMLQMVRPVDPCRDRLSIVIDDEITVSARRNVGGDAIIHSWKLRGCVAANGGNFVDCAATSSICYSLSA
jgi:hypothetical protein